MQNVPRMPDLVPNPNYKPSAEQEQPKPKKKVVRRKRKPSATGANTPKASQPQTKAPERSGVVVPPPPTSGPKRPLPRSSVSQPRDHMGRFASKAGQVLWGAAKGTVSAIGSGIKTAKKVNKTIKRSQTASRRRQNKEREQNLKKKKKKVIRRKR